MLLLLLNIIFFITAGTCAGHHHLPPINCPAGKAEEQAESCGCEKVSSLFLKHISYISYISYAYPFKNTFNSALNQVILIYKKNNSTNDKIYCWLYNTAKTK